MRIYHNDQIDLGHLALDRYAGEYGAEFDAIGERAFTEGLRKDAALDGASQRAVAELRSARSGNEIEAPTRKRMAEVQGLLCDLLERLEQQHGVKVFRSGTRKRASTS